MTYQSLFYFDRKHLYLFWFFWLWGRWKLNSVSLWKTLLILHGNDNLNCFEMVVVEYCSNRWNSGWPDRCFLASRIIALLNYRQNIHCWLTAKITASLVVFDFLAESEQPSRWYNLPMNRSVLTYRFNYGNPNCDWLTGGAMARLAVNTGAVGWSIGPRVRDLRGTSVFMTTKRFIHELSLVIFRVVHLWQHLFVFRCIKSRWLSLKVKQRGMTNR